MTDDTLAIFREARTFQGSLVDLHPLKLDRWHRGLVGLPDAIYMQYGCPALYEQVGKALEGVKAMVDLLGADNLPMDPKEIARRRIGQFGWHIPLEQSPTGTTRCLLTWNQQDTAWELTCEAAPRSTKTVRSFEAGFEIAGQWVGELEEESSKDEE